MPCAPKTVPTWPIMPGHVAVAEHRDVLLELDHEAVAPDLGEVRDLARADAGPGDRDALAAGDDGHADQLVEVLGLAARLLLDDDPALLRRTTAALT